MPRKQSHGKSVFAKTWSWFIRGPWRIVLSILAGVVALFTYFNEIVDFINNLKENIGLLLTIIIATSLFIVIVSFWYLITHKNRLARNTKVFIVGISTLILFISIGFGWYSYSAQKTLEKKFIIAIADFYSTNQRDYGVTEDISYKLSQLLADEPDMVVAPLNKPITETEGSAEAVRQGKNIYADMIFWGWYTVTDSDVLITIHIEDLSTQSNISSLDLPDSYQVQADITKINTFKLQKELSDDFSGIAFFLKGNASTSENNVDKAIEYYSKAIDKETFVNKWIFYYQRGSTYLFSVKGMDGALNAVTDLEKAIESMPSGIEDEVNAYNTLGSAYFRARNFENARNIQNYALKLQLRDASS